MEVRLQYYTPGHPAITQTPPRVSLLHWYTLPPFDLPRWLTLYTYGSHLTHILAAALLLGTV